MKFQVTEEIEELIDIFLSLTSEKTIFFKNGKTKKATVPIKGTLTFDFKSGTRTFDVTPTNQSKKRRTKSKSKVKKVVSTK